MWYSDDCFDVCQECPDCLAKDYIMARCRKLAYDIVLNMHWVRVGNYAEVENLLYDLCDYLGVKTPPPSEDRLGGE